MAKSESDALRIRDRLGDNAEILMDSRPLWKRVRDELRIFRPQLRFCARATVAALLAFVVASSLNFPLHGLWMVLTALLVAQVSVGASLRATIDYIVGTCGGAVYAAAVGVLVPHATAMGQALALALAVAPLALAAAIAPSFRVAPFSAALVLLIGGELGQGPIASALTRLSEVALGGGIAAVVSILVVPEPAYRLGLEAASRILLQMAELLPALLVAGVTQAADSAAISCRQDDLGRSVAAFDALAAEAKRERMVSLARQPMPHRCRGLSSGSGMIW